MKRTVRLVLALAVIVGLLGGCSAAPAPESRSSAPAPAATAAPAAKPAEAPRQPGAASSDSTGRSPANSYEPGASAAPWDRMVIRTTTLNLTVKNVEESLTAIRNLTQANDGYVAELSNSYRDDQMVATVRVQVPARNLDAMIDQVRKLAIKVNSEQTTSQDVTEEFTDQQSQLRNLQATEASLLKLMDQATQVSDILALQRELSNVRGQIERIQGRINYLQRRSDMSTLTVSLTPEALAQQPGWQPLKTAQAAWKASLDVVVGIAEVVVAVVVFSWWLVPLVALVVWLWRRRPRRRPAPVATPAPPGPTVGG